MRDTHYRLATALSGVAVVVSLACVDVAGPVIQPIQTNTGIIELSVTTSGADLDTDGYYVYVENIGKVDLPPNGTRTVAGVKAGQWELTLAGLSGNCAVEGPRVQQVNVTLNKRVEVAFAIRCTQMAVIEVTTHTSGVEVDKDGYQLELYNEITGVRASHLIPSNGTAAISRLFPGNYRLTLSGLAPNCDPNFPNPRSMIVAMESTAPVGFDVTCVPPKQLAFVRWSLADADIYTIYSNGTRLSRLTNAPGADVNPAWSPDGSRIAFASDRSGNLEIYVMSANGDDVRRLTTSAAGDYLPAWSPDGARIAFVSERDGNAEIYVMNADGTNPSRLTAIPAPDSEPAWSPDGSRIAFRSNQSGNGDIYVIGVDGSALTQLTSNLYPDSQPAWSPDGKRIAYTAGADGVIFNGDVIHYIYVMNVDGSQSRRLINEGGVAQAEPAWSTDGQKVAFASSGCSIWDYYDYCIPSVQIATSAGIRYKTTVEDAAEPTWRP